MSFPATCLAILLAFAASGCAYLEPYRDWKSSVDHHSKQLGYKNWIIISEAAFPAQNRSKMKQIYADAEVPEVLDHLLHSLERNQHVQPTIYQTRELRSLENDFAPGIDQLRERISSALHSHEPIELDQQSLLTLLESTEQNYQVLLIRTPTALPYSTVFLELKPGYWDADSEEHLRKKISKEKAEKLASP
jgi:L-fucose mutarotase/ribose pyranase (RbsD/FucU family)